MTKTLQLGTLGGIGFGTISGGVSSGVGRDTFEGLVERGIVEGGSVGFIGR